MKTKFCAAVLRSAALAGVLAIIPALCHAGDDFKPVDPSELAMKDNPANPGAHAMILEWTENRNDDNAFDDYYCRMKIFTEEGKKYADIELPYWKNEVQIGGIKARVIRPDGTIVPFTGKVFDKLLVKAGGVKVQAKTFSLPDVQPGSIIEYKYREEWDRYTLFSAHWELQRDLFMKKATYRLQTYTGPGWSNYWMGIGLPNGKKIDRKGTVISLDLDNVPAFDEERYAPPERELKPRVDFYYSDHSYETADKYWPRIGREDTDFTESYIGNNRKGVTQALSTIIAAGDNTDTKLRKIYAFTQTLRNITYERDKTAQEQKRDKTKDDKSADDVLKNGYGDRADITFLFIALARAAGVEAYPLLLSTRDTQFFNQELPDRKQLDSYVAYVKADGKELYLDPGTVYCPYGLLRWQRTGVKGMLLQKNNNIFIQTPNPDSKNSVTKRIITMKMTDSGFSADIAVAYYGYEALEKRLDVIEDDEAEVRQGLEDEMKKTLPGGSTVKLASIDNAKDASKPLIVDFTVTLPDFTSSIGSRRLVPLAVLEMGDRNPFQHENRKHPVYYPYPFQEFDQVTLELPPGYTIESVPDPRMQQPAFGYYSTTWDKKANAIVLHRTFAVLGVFFRTEFYKDLRDFYGKVSSGDQDNVVLRSSTSASN